MVSQPVGMQTFTLKLFDYVTIRLSDYQTI